MSSSQNPRYSLGDDLTLAHRLADAADAITLKRYQANDLIVTTKPDNTPVTDADKSTEEAIRALLHAHRPEDGVVGEEFGNEGVEKDRYWVIDPIDGTKNFLRGVPTWATLIGLVERTAERQRCSDVGMHIKAVAPLSLSIERAQNGSMSLACQRVKMHLSLTLIFKGGAMHLNHSKLC